MVLQSGGMSEGRTQTWRMVRLDSRLAKNALFRTCSTGQFWCQGRRLLEPKGSVSRASSVSLCAIGFVPATLSIELGCLLLMYVACTTLSNIYEQVWRDRFRTRDYIDVYVEDTSLVYHCAAIGFVPATQSLELGCAEKWQCIAKATSLNSQCNGDAKGSEVLRPHGVVIACRTL